MGPMLEPPSPQMIAYDAIVPSRSLEADPSAVMGTKVSALEGDTDRDAMGARFRTVTWAESVSCSPSVSVTVSVTVYRPSFVYSCVAMGPGLAALSPHAMRD